MATMVKEKRREKKKVKEKQVFRNNEESEPSISSSNRSVEGVVEIASETVESFVESVDISDIEIKDSSTTEQENNVPPSVLEESVALSQNLDISQMPSSSELGIKQKNSHIQTATETSKLIRDEHPGKTYQDLNLKIERMSIPLSTPLSIEAEQSLEAPTAYIKEPNLSLESQSDKNVVATNEDIQNPSLLEAKLSEKFKIPVEDVLPSAPVFEEMTVPESKPQEYTEVKEEVPKIQCMPLEKAVWLFGGEEMAEVREMSEREESIVEVGPLSGPDHPLVDLLSTLRSSLICLDRERNQLFKNFSEEERCRAALWKVEKKTVYVSDMCPCGATVQFRGKYDHAEFMMDRLPAARMRLTALLRDVQESYCHHQHSALLAFYQIEDFLSQVVRGNKNEMRESLSLVLQALKLSDSAPAVLSKLLERWAGMLASALVDARELRHLLFLLHHLFRQSRSVRWAWRAVVVHVGDRVSAARAVALLALMLARPALDSALECTEEIEEAWEEVDRTGGSGAVGDGTLRERDLLALMKALPLRQLVANILQFTNSDVSKAREQDWRDSSGGRGVLRACCGVRTLLDTLVRARKVHSHYDRLHRTLRRIGERTLVGLAGLHLQTEAFYTAEMRERIPLELEACFSAGLALFEHHDLPRLPATLLTELTARELCMELIFNLHDCAQQQLSSLPVVLPPLSCETRVQVIAQVAAQRKHEHELARIVLEFLMQTGLKKKSVTCKGGCESAARAHLPTLLDAHPYLYTIALHLIADMNQVEALEPSCVKFVQVDKWRPNNGELLVVLEDWSQRCPVLLQHLLLNVTCTPHVGLSLQTQLSLGSWLCDWSRSQPNAEWRWSVLRRLRVHRAAWCLPLNAPDPDPAPDEADLFATAYALLATSWGHSIPLALMSMRRLRVHRAAWYLSLNAPDPEPAPDKADLFATAHALLATSWGHSIPSICSHGAAALCRLASARPLDAAHCLAAVMLAMAVSPDSIALATKFTEFFNIMLNSGPGLVQRALGLGGVNGAQLLQKVMLAHLGDEVDPAEYQLNRSMMLMTWLHALWRPVTSPACALLADTALLATREFHRASDYAARMTQEMTKDQASQWVRLASTAPQLVECVLRSLLGNEHRHAMSDRLSDTLHLQRINNVKINVDSALQQLGTGMWSDELVIHRASCAALIAPYSQPGHLMLWRLFMNLYLQRPSCSLQESTPPVGPLFFSGIMKSRTMSSIKKRIQETITYHQNEALSFKTAQNPEVKPDSSERVVRKSKESSKSTNEFLGALSIADFTGESSEASDSECSEEEEGDGVIVAETSRDEEKDGFHMYCYHVAAEKMLREYARWLDEGDNVRASPHHAEVARFIPEQAMNAAWQRVVAQRRCPVECELPLPAPEPPPPRPPPTLFETTLKNILLIKDRSVDRRRSIVITSALGDSDVSDARVLLSLVDKHLQLVEKYAGEWRTEVTRITSLDEQLLSLVKTLRVPRDLPAQRVRCANRCKPRTLVPKAREWCISNGAEEGIRDNRQSARASVRRLTKPAMPVVRAAVALQALARSIGSAATARRVVERAWRGVAACGGCLPAHAALLMLFQDIAERWICHDGALCAELLSRWSAGAASSGNALQQILCGTIVAPRQLPAHDWPAVYTALLRSQLPSHAAFSYLSKFEVSRWAASSSSESRSSMLSALTAAATRWAAYPEPQHHVLLELIGVHTTALISGSELSSYIARCAKESAACRLPPQHWTHVLNSVRLHALHVHVDELGHLLRELGTVWWETRTSHLPENALELYAAYAPHISAVLTELQRAFVAATVALSYAPERVCTYAWSGARESWSPWVQPSTATALLSRAHREDMVVSFLDTLHHTMADCPGIEEHLVGEVWEWVSTIYLSLSGPGSLRDEDTRDQLWTLLRILKQLPFQRPWFRPRHLHPALQVCRAPDVEFRSWCASTLRGFSASRALTQSDAELAPQLAGLLCLFTAPHTPYTDETLSEACGLPWWRLPEVALDEALDRFFMEHYDLTLPYHETLHFRVLLSACELSPFDGPSGRSVRVQPPAREKRARGVSAWQRAASVPKLVAHAPAHAAALLQVITDIAPYLEESQSEVEELLSRAVVIMCIEPAGAAVLPVWEQWVSSCPPRLRAACVSASSSLTAFESFVTLADAATRAFLAAEYGSWSEIQSRWSSCPWSDASPLAARARLHAAYGIARAHLHSYQTLRATLLALLAADVNFIDNAAIVSTWICLACRTARTCSLAVESLSSDCDAARECMAAAIALLMRWAEPPRRSLLRLVGMQQATDVPTAEHRLLCNLALCILSPGSETALRGFESACGAVNPATLGDANTWGKSPRPAMLPRLAVRFHAPQERYFKEEMELVAEL